MFSRSIGHTWKIVLCCCVLCLPFCLLWAGMKNASETNAPYELSSANKDSLDHFPRTSSARRNNASYWFAKEGYCNVIRGKIDKKHSTRCVHFAAIRGVAEICVYQPPLDAVSLGVIRHNLHDQEYVDEIQYILALNKNIQFLDIGAGIGVYTMVACLWGNRVLAVDGHLGNVIRLQESVARTKCRSEITVIHNLVSGSRYSVTLWVNPHDVTDGGHLQADKSIPMVPSEVSTILLNDLGHFIKSQQIVLRLKPPSHSNIPQIISNSLDFFTNNLVSHILMDWGNVKQLEKSHTQGIVELFRSLKYYPFQSVRRRAPLYGDELMWPDIVFFIHQDIYRTFGGNK